MAPSTSNANNYPPLDGPEAAPAVQVHFAAGLVPETQETCIPHLPAKRPRMTRDPSWNPHYGALTVSESNALIEIRNNILDHVSTKFKVLK